VKILQKVLGGGATFLTHTVHILHSAYSFGNSIFFSLDLAFNLLHSTQQQNGTTKALNAWLGTRWQAFLWILIAKRKYSSCEDDPPISFNLHWMLNVLTHSCSAVAFLHVTLQGMCPLKFNIYFDCTFSSESRLMSLYCIGCLSGFVNLFDKKLSATLYS